MIVKLNNKKHEIPKYSELTTKEFCRIAESKVSSIPEYLSLFVDLPVGDLLNAEYKTPSGPYLFTSIFDIDISEALTRKYNTFEHGKETILMKDVYFSTFGKAYLFDIYHQNHREKKINKYELFLYSLAIAISKDPKLSDVEKIKNQFDKQVWTKVIPHAFFLEKKFLRSRNRFQVQSIIYTLQFKEISMRINHSLKKLRRLETTLT